MMGEGRGKVAPAPKLVRLSAAERVQLRAAAAKREQFRGYAARSDAWGNGMIGDAVFHGLCGEHALCRYLNSALGLQLHVDLALRRAGDGGLDVNALGFRMQVKTRVRGEQNLIRRLDHNKRIVPIACDAFVFAKIVPGGVQLLGWVTAEFARDGGAFAKSPRRDSGHFNLVVDGSDLEPMRRLSDRIRCAQGAA